MTLKKTTKLFLAHSANVDCTAIYLLSSNWCKTLVASYWFYQRRTISGWRSLIEIIQRNMGNWQMFTMCKTFFPGPPPAPQASNSLHHCCTWKQFCQKLPMGNLAFSLPLSPPHSTAIIGHGTGVVVHASSIVIRQEERETRGAIRDERDRSLSWVMGW